MEKANKAAEPMEKAEASSIRPPKTGPMLCPKLIASRMQAVNAVFVIVLLGYPYDSSSLLPPTKAAIDCGANDDPRIT